MGRSVLSAVSGVRTVGVALLVVAASAIPARAERIEPLPKQLEGVGITEHPGAQVPLELEFTDENGSTVKLAQFFTSGKPVVLNLGYYRCPMLCGLVLNGLLQGLREMPWTAGKEFEIVTVSIDPLETPELARAKKANYIDAYGRPGAATGWHFLTGKEANIKKLADAVGFGYRYLPEQEQYAHAAGLFVATPDGHMARYLYGVLYAPKTLRLALTEAGEGKVGTTTDRFLLFCFHYDAQQGRYVVAAQTIMRIGGAGTVVGLAAFLILWWRRDARRGTARREEKTT